jgi:hypothetical protein
VQRNLKIINHHIYSSIWSGIKGNYSDILNNSSWVLGKGDCINFWLDSWCGDPIAHSLGIPAYLYPHLTSTVNLFLADNHWLIPPILLHRYPQLSNILSNVSIPIDSKPDELMWNNSSSGSLSLKDAYLYQDPVGQKLLWSKIIWNISIPPSRSLLVWRLIHHKLPTDDNLLVRGCHLPSVCSICFVDNETSPHLFFQCSFASYLWRWFLSLINIHCSISCFDDLWSICNRGWGPQCKFVIIAAIINILNTIWQFRNQCRFNGTKPLLNSAMALIIANTSFSGNATKSTTNSSMVDFRILKVLMYLFILLTLLQLRKWFGRLLLFLGSSVTLMVLQRVILGRLLVLVFSEITMLNS